MMILYGRSQDGIVVALEVDGANLSVNGAPLRAVSVSDRGVTIVCDDACYVLQQALVDAWLRLAHASERPSGAPRRRRYRRRRAPSTH